MKHTVTNLYRNVQSAWVTRPALRRLVYASVPVLLLGFLLGGIRTAMLLTGYLQLVSRAVLPGEPVENNAAQRLLAFTGGLTRMLFFTGMMTQAAWPFVLMAAAQALGLTVLRFAEHTGAELSILPMLASAGFLLLGLLVGAPVPAVVLTLSAALTATAAHMLLRAGQTLRQLRMRFHLA